MSDSLPSFLPKTTCLGFEPRGSLLPKNLLQAVAMTVCVDFQDSFYPPFFIHFFLHLFRRTKLEPVLLLVEDVTLLLVSQILKTLLEYQSFFFTTDVSRDSVTTTSSIQFCFNWSRSGGYKQRGVIVI